eukprot:4508763-Pyramimonas_sp.AAC.1
MPKRDHWKSRNEAMTLTKARSVLTATHAAAPSYRAIRTRTPIRGEPSSLCYGQHTCMNRSGPCGGEEGISQLELTWGTDRCNKAISHYLRARRLGVVILQLACRTTGLASYFNAMINYNAWWKSQQGDLPRIAFCVAVAK